MWFARISESLLSTLFPTACHECGALVENLANGVACSSCWEKLTTLSPMTGCPRCSYPLDTAFDNRLWLNSCKKCKDLTFSYARAYAYYEGAIKASIIYLKKNPVICNRLHQLICSLLETDPILKGSDLIIPVPLHSERLSERGFNQAEVIASILSRNSTIAVDCQSLQRTISTVRHRAGMDRQDRFSSLRSAFEVTRPRLVAGRKILLVDDLFTTGTTLSVCAERLFAAGAEQVCILTLARVV